MIPSKVRCVCKLWVDLCAMFAVLSELQKACNLSPGEFQAIPIQLYPSYWSSGSGAVMIWWPKFICLPLSFSLLNEVLQTPLEYCEISSRWYSHTLIFLQLRGLRSSVVWSIFFRFRTCHRSHVAFTVSSATCDTIEFTIAVYPRELSRFKPWKSLEKILP